MVKVYFVKGLNMESDRFVWNDKLIIADAGSEYGNVAEIRVFIDKQISKISEFTFDSNPDAEIMCLITIFLTCFHLVNEDLHLELTDEWVSGYSVNSFEDFKTSSSGLTKEWSDTDFPKIPEKYCKKYLENTIPLFEKVIRNIDTKQQISKNPLAIALHLFQKIDGRDNLKSIIDYVVVLESLVCENERNLKFKLASRVSFLLQTDSEDTKWVQQFLKKIYRLRSEYVHGSKISIDEFSEKYTEDRFKLERIVRHVLLNYVELIDSGLNKKDIIKELDSCKFG